MNQMVKAVKSLPGVDPRASFKPPDARTATSANTEKIITRSDEIWRYSPIKSVMRLYTINTCSNRILNPILLRSCWFVRRSSGFLFRRAGTAAGAAATVEAARGALVICARLLATAVNDLATDGLNRLKRTALYTMISDKNDTFSSRDNHPNPSSA